MRIFRSSVISVARRVRAGTAIFLIATSSLPAVAEAILIPSAAPVAPLGGARVTGEITGIIGSGIQLKLRTGRTMAINLRTAKAHDLVPQLYAGELVQVQGHLTSHTAMVAAAVMRAKSAPAAWSPDIP